MLKYLKKIGLYILLKEMHIKKMLNLNLFMILKKMVYME